MGVNINLRKPNVIMNTNVAILIQSSKGVSIAGNYIGVPKGDDDCSARKSSVRLNIYQSWSIMLSLAIAQSQVNKNGIFVILSRQVSIGFNPRSTLPVSQQGNRICHSMELEIAVGATGKLSAETVCDNYYMQSWLTIFNQTDGTNTSNRLQVGVLNNIMYDNLNIPYWNEYYQEACRIPDEHMHLCWCGITRASWVNLLN